MEVLDDLQEVRSDPAFVYRMSDDAVKKWAIKTRNRYMLILPLVLIIGVIVSQLKLTDLGRDWLNYMPTVIFMLVFTLIYSIYKGKNVVKNWRNFRITLTETEIIREADGLKTHHLGRDDIKEIRILKNGFIYVVGHDAVQNIIIPPSINRKDDLIEALSDYAQVKQVSNNYLLPAYLHYLFIAYPFLLLFTFVLDNKWFALASFTVILFLVIWTVSYMLRNPQVTTRQKIQSLFYLVILAVVAWKTASLFGIMPTIEQLLSK